MQRATPELAMLGNVKWRRIAKHADKLNIFGEPGHENTRPRRAITANDWPRIQRIRLRRLYVVILIRCFAGVLTDTTRVGARRQGASPALSGICALSDRVIP